MILYNFSAKVYFNITQSYNPVIILLTVIVFLCKIKYKITSALDTLN